MKKRNPFIACLFLICLITACDNPPPAEAPPTPAKTCVGYTEHGHTKTWTNTFVLNTAGKTCFEVGNCDDIKKRMIEEATKEAATYCRDFQCSQSSDSCKGIFTLTSSNCSMSSSVTANGQTICTETVTIIGKISCGC